MPSAGRSWWSYTWSAGWSTVSSVDATVADVFTVESGQIVTMMAYADPEEAFRAATDPRAVPGPA